MAREGAPGTGDEGLFAPTGDLRAIRAASMAESVLSDLLAPRDFDKARDAGAAWCVGADEAALALGYIGEADFQRALARRLNLGFVELDALPPVAGCLTEKRALVAASGGLLPLGEGPDGTIVAQAPRGGAVDRLAKAIEAMPELRGQLRLATQDAIARRVMASGFVLDHAVSGLARRHGIFSAMRITELPYGRIAGLALAAFALMALVHAGWTLALLNLVACTVFLVCTYLRVEALLAPGRPAAPLGAPLADGDLPVYTVLVPLYREARILPDLVAALAALDYPAAKLDVKLLLEADDAETRGAAGRLDLPPFMTILVVPPAHPRTKPKALNVGLAFAHGALVTVYDAEDRPAPDQLRRAAGLFAQAEAELACLQARLVIDNAEDSWLTRQFAIEYDALFRRLLPTYGRLGIPLPLGGTSNHFRVDILRAVGGWDPYNVTEDADLGIRLARRGYRCAAFDSDTFEEAPHSVRAWRAQRTRWFKGWIVTWLVHLRAPRRLWRDLGPVGFFGVQAVITGMFVSALAHPVVPAALMAYLAFGDFGALALAAASLNGAILVAGYGTAMALGMAAVATRPRLARSIPLMPIYWLLQAWAALAAIVELVRRPFHWAKTEHGLARRRAPQKQVARPARSVSR